MFVKRKQSNQPDEFDILSSIWILSCNDENPIITYGGIKFRLGLGHDFDVKKLVAKRGDLFRLKAQPRRLEEWKNEMLQGKKLPGFISNIDNKEQREKVIHSITVNDVFRNQFRAEVDVPRAQIEILDWGIQQINRIRQTQVDIKERRLRWISSLWIPIGSLLVTSLALILTHYAQVKSDDTQIQLKKYEVTFKTKQENYSRFMQGLYDTFGSTIDTNLRMTKFRYNVNQLEIIYFNIEPFLDKSTRNKIWNGYLNFTSMCIDYNMTIRNKHPDEDYTDSLLKYKSFFHDNLYPALFGNN